LHIVLTKADTSAMQFYLPHNYGFVALTFPGADPEFKLDLPLLSLVMPLIGVN